MRYFLITAIAVCIFFASATKAKMLPAFGKPRISTQLFRAQIPLRPWFWKSQKSDFHYFHNAISSKLPSHTRGSFGPGTRRLQNSLMNKLNMRIRLSPINLFSFLQPITLLVSIKYSLKLAHRYFHFLYTIYTCSSNSNLNISQNSRTTYNIPHATVFPLLVYGLQFVRLAST